MAQQLVLGILVDIYLIILFLYYRGICVPGPFPHHVIILDASRASLIGVFGAFLSIIMMGYTRYLFWTNNGGFLDLVHYRCMFATIK